MDDDVHILGDLEIKNKGDKPTKYIVKNFLDYSLEKIKAINLEAHVHGSVLTDWKSANDFDFRLTGKITDYDQLENLLFDLNDYAFNKINLKLDLKWSSDTDIVKIDENNEIVFNDVEYIMFGYRLRVINNKKSLFDYSIHNKVVNHEFYKPVSRWLIKSNYNKLTIRSWLNKSNQEEEIRKHGKFLFIPARTFLTSIDEYFRE
jgi:hypothetical protein